MKDLNQNKKLFDATYSSNTEKARKEMTKSVFVAPSPSDIKVFTYRSAYEIEDQASLIKCTKSTISHDEAIEEATQELTGLSIEDYSQKIDELFFQKENSYRDINLIWENYQFPTPELDFSDLPNYAGLDISKFHPKNMLKRGIESIHNASIIQLRTQEFEEAFFTSKDNMEEFLLQTDDKDKFNTKSKFLDYIKHVLEQKEKKNETNKSELKTKPEKEIYHNTAKAIGIPDSNLQEFIGLCQELVLYKIAKVKDFSKKMLYSYWNFQKEAKSHHLKYYGSSVLYYGKYAKDFINLYEHNFFRHSEDYDDDIKYGVSLWSELSTQGSKKCSDSCITPSTLDVVVAKSYRDGSTETVATLCFDYTICFYKDEKSANTYISKNDDIAHITGEKIYNLLSQQFYPLYGISVSKGEGIDELTNQLTLDEGERGGILELRDINISSKYSDKIIPELIKGVYDLVNFNSASSFPLFSCMVNGDIMVNDELFPIIKSPLLTVISSDYLTKRIHKMQEEKSERDFKDLNFFSEYQGNAHHYYNRMTFDPLRPIFVY